MNNGSALPALYELKRVVLLANSRKHAERCIAGREIVAPNYGGWIRPVSARDGEGVSWQERTYASGQEPQLLDIVDIPVRRYKPHANQTENWLLYPHARWNKVGALTYQQAEQLAEVPALLWNSGNSTYNGKNDQVSALDAKLLKSSICMIKVDALQVKVFAPGAAFQNPKRRVQALFLYNNVNYSLWITDAALERQFLEGADGVTTFGKCLLVVSLSEPHETGGKVNHYKLVAGIIFP